MLSLENTITLMPFKKILYSQIISPLKNDYHKTNPIVITKEASLATNGF
jgi:hypothetical protein